METRNILARQGTQSDADSIDQFYDILIALSYSIAWLLRTVLLVEAGFDAATLQEAYRCSSAYNHHITTREICAAAALTLPPQAPPPVKRRPSSPAGVAIRWAIPMCVAHRLS
jgi:hypothetical protein